MHVFAIAAKTTEKRLRSYKVNSAPTLHFLFSEPFTSEPRTPSGRGQKFLAAKAYL